MGCICLSCGGTGIKLDGSQCECQAGLDIQFPALSEIPIQYQETKFNKTFVKSTMPIAYGNYMESLLTDILEKRGAINKNILICAPPNTGKTVLGYSVYGLLYAKGIATPEILDLVEVRGIFMGKCIDVDKMTLWTKSPIAFIKIPMDVPGRYGETISTIIDRRVRNNGSTIFLFNGNKHDLEALDTFNKFKPLMGDGTFMSLDVKNFEESK